MKFTSNNKLLIFTRNILFGKVTIVILQVKQPYVVYASHMFDVYVLNLQYVVPVFYVTIMC